MTIQHDVLLNNYSTMRLGGKAKALAEVHSKTELTEAVTWAKENNLPLLVLGGGSNIIFRDGYDGFVLLNRIGGLDTLQQNAQYTTLRIGAGENWDDTVKKTVAMNLSGIEALSYIPGTVGGTPVQNVGAYGAEIAQTLVELEAYDLTTQSFTTLTNKDCHFSYRNSIFKNPQHRHHIIVNVTLRLSTNPPKPPFYDSLQKYLNEHGTTSFTPAVIRDAVIAIRKVKLPDPSVIANSGSFFKNPIVSAQDFATLHQKYPEMPSYAMPNGEVKLLAGWLIDRTGLKGYKAHGMKVYEENALVFVNESARSYDDLAAFRQEVVEKVMAKFDIILEQEPELV